MKGKNMSLLNSSFLRPWEHADNLLIGMFHFPPWCAHSEDSPAHPAARVPKEWLGRRDLALHQKQRSVKP